MNLEHGVRRIKMGDRSLDSWGKLFLSHVLEN